MMNEWIGLAGSIKTMAYPVRLRWAEDEAWIDTIITKPIVCHSLCYAMLCTCMDRDYVVLSIGIECDTGAIIWPIIGTQFHESFHRCIRWTCTVIPPPLSLSRRASAAR